MGNLSVADSAAVTAGLTVCASLALWTPLVESKGRNLRTSEMYTRREPLGLVPPLLQQPSPLGLPFTLPLIANVSNQPLADDGDALVSTLCQIRNAAMGSGGTLS
jgi:hypothetical protein